jgi:hypothetical protein
MLDKDWIKISMLSTIMKKRTSYAIIAETSWRLVCVFVLIVE